MSSRSRTDAFCLIARRQCGAFLPEDSALERLSFGDESVSTPRVSRCRPRNRCSSCIEVCRWDRVRFAQVSGQADPEVSAITSDYVRPGQNQMITSRGRAWKVRNATVAVSGSTGLDVATHPQAVVRQIAASIDVVGLSGGGTSDIQSTVRSCVGRGVRVTPHLSVLRHVKGDGLAQCLVDSRRRFRSCSQSRSYLASLGYHIHYRVLIEVAMARLRVAASYIALTALFVAVIFHAASQEAIAEILGNVAFAAIFLLQAIIPQRNEDAAR